MHLDPETLERALHGELASEARVEVERHLASCALCAERLTEAERAEARLFGLLEEIDHEPPASGGKAAWERPAAGRVTDVRMDRSRSALAASLAFLLLAAAALAVLPGSPVRTWLESAFRRTDGPAATAPGPAARSGIAVVPDTPFEVVFAFPQATGRVRVRLVDAGRVELTVTGEPVELESGAGRLVVGNEGSSASYELGIPRDLESVRVTVGEDTILERSGERIRASAAADAEGTWVLDLRRD